MKTLKLEVGKTYLSRNGKEVKIIENDGIVEYSYEGSDGEWYTESGKWSYVSEEHPKDLIEEVTRHTFTIPEGVSQVTIEQVGNRIVVEMVPKEDEDPKPGGAMIDAKGNVYIFKSVFKSVVDSDIHKHFAWFGKDGRLVIGSMCTPGRPATAEEAQPLFDALKKAGKKWNPETMQVEGIPEIDRIREWVEEHWNGDCGQEGIVEVIESYLKYKEDKQ